MQRTAVEAAVGEAGLRSASSGVFRSLARRSQSLLQRQLGLLDSMERGTDDPDALRADLFRLDHLTTRMRRHAEGLIVLSGAAPGRRWREPVPLVEVLRGATGEIEDYARVDLDAHTQDRVAGGAVADVTHLLAELIENAANYSPPGTQVRVVAYRAAGGLVVEIEDRGIGIPQDTLAVLNHRLANPPEFDLVDADQLGLFVVSRLADRQQIRVSLRVSSYGGTSATVLLPYQIVVQGDDPKPARPGRRVVARRPAAQVLRQLLRYPALRGASRTGEARAPPDQARALEVSIHTGRAGAQWQLGRSESRFRHRWGAGMTEVPPRGELSWLLQNLDARVDRAVRAGGRAVRRSA